jgi:hypothetical protein
MFSKRPTARIRPLFARVKWPGWLAIIIAVFNGLPDFTGRIQFWFGAARTMTGYVGDVATVMGSPYFSPVLFLTGLAYLFLVGHQPRVAHPIWPVLGWAVFGLVGLAFWSVLVAGYVASRQNSEQAWQWPKMTDGQKENLAQLLHGIGSLPFGIECTCSDCCSLGADLAEAVQKAGWPRPSIGPGGTDSIGAAGLGIECSASQVKTAFAMSAAINKVLHIDAPVYPWLRTGMALIIGIYFQGLQQPKEYVGSGVAPPSSGHGYNIGNKWRNTSPTPGSNEGWICAAPPTGSGDCVWVAFGPISL